MSKRKLNVFVDVLTILLVVFPLVMCVATAIFNGSFDVLNIGAFVEQFEISNALTSKISSSVAVLGFAIDGAFANVVFVIMSNALLIYVFRVFVAVMIYVPKMAYKFINLEFGGK